MTTLFDEIKESLVETNGEWKEKRGVRRFSTVIAERKALLSSKRLTYSFRLKIDHATRLVHFSEILIESGSGFSADGDLDGGSSSGFGVRTETYNTFKKPRQGTIEEQSRLFGNEYTFHFEFNTIRSRVQQITEAHGYAFDYQVLPVK